MAGDKFPEMPLGEIVDFRNGKAISPERYSERGRCPVFGSNGQIARTDDSLNPEAVVAIGRVGAYCGSVHYIPEPSWVTDNAIVALPKPGNDLRFLYYLLGNLELRRTAIGSAQPLMTQGGLRVLRSVVPTFPVQRAIARILGSLDDKIELNRRMNETLEAMARAIFKSWFVDFDPVHAKAEGRQPVGMDTATAALFPDSFEGSALGEIPRGWGVGSLGGAVTINEHSVTAAYPHDAIEYVDISSVAVGILTGTMSCKISEAPSRARRLVKQGDTIWSCVRPNRRSYLLISKPLPNLVVSTGFAVLTPNAIPPAYLYAWVTTDEFVDYLAARADGSAYPAVRPDDFASADVLFPPAPILARFEERVGPMRELIAHNWRESQTLAALRDALLPKLMSGEARVGESGEAMEPVVVESFTPGVKNIIDSAAT